MAGISAAFTWPSRLKSPAAKLLPMIDKTPVVVSWLVFHSNPPGSAGSCSDENVPVNVPKSQNVKRVAQSPAQSH